MSFSRVKGLGWAAGEELTKAQITALDRNISLAVDKTGDTIPSGATITWAGGSTLAAAGTTTISGLLTNSSGRIHLDARLTLSVAATTLTASGGSSSIVVSGAGSLIKNSTGVAGGARFQLADNDYPTFSPARTVTKLVPLAACGTKITTGAASWLVGADGFYTTSSAAGALVIALPYPVLRAGATLAQVDLLFTPANTHTSLPASGPAIAVLQRNVATGAGVGPRASMSSGTYSTTLDVYNSGAVQTLSISPALVTNNAYEYAIQLTEESGGGALGGTVYHAVKLTYSLSDMTSWA